MNKTAFDILRSLFGAALAAVESSSAVSTALADPVVSVPRQYTKMPLLRDR